LSLWVGFVVRSRGSVVMQEGGEKEDDSKGDRSKCNPLEN